MKTENFILIGGIAALGLYLYSKGQSSTSLPSDFEYMGKAPISISIPPEYQGMARRTLKEEQAEQKVMDTAAQQNQSITFTSQNKGSKRIVGVQDASLGMSYRIEADKTLLAKAAPKAAAVPIKIVGTPYTTTSKTAATKLNNPLAVAAAKLTSSSKKLKK